METAARLLDHERAGDHLHLAEELGTRLHRGPGSLIVFSPPVRSSPMPKSGNMTPDMRPPVRGITLRPGAFMRIPRSTYPVPFLSSTL